MEKIKSLSLAMNTIGKEIVGPHLPIKIMAEQGFFIHPCIYVCMYICISIYACQLCIYVCTYLAKLEMAGAGECLVGTCGGYLCVFFAQNPDTRTHRQVAANGYRVPPKGELLLCGI
jgi:hypothetical protein